MCVDHVGYVSQVLVEAGAVVGDGDVGSPVLDALDVP
jgi:hypothetical protein